MPGANTVPGVEVPARTYGGKVAAGTAGAEVAARVEGLAGTAVADGAGPQEAQTSLLALGSTPGVKSEDVSTGLT